MNAIVAKQCLSFHCVIKTLWNWIAS